MKKRIVVSLIAAVAVIVPSASAGSTTPTGSKLPFNFNRTNTSMAIQANTPFYVNGGFGVDDPSSGCNPCDTISDVQQSQVNLYVNGVSQKGTVIQQFSNTTPRTLTFKNFLFNFPSGLPVGSYVFRVEYFIRGAVTYTNTVTIDAVASCQYGTVTTNPGAGLLCAPPPA